MDNSWNKYQSDQFYDELIQEDRKPRKAAEQLVNYLSGLEQDELDQRKQMAEATIAEMGVSFTVYTDEGNIDRPGHSTFCRGSSAEKTGKSLKPV